MHIPLISIIVPIYKVEPYLRQCLDSIIQQTYTHLEIILVDDGSPDRCSQICDEYAAKDKRIVVIHKKNGGLSDARNAGLGICKGEFILFVDSDDVLDNDTIRILLSPQEKASIIIGDIKNFDDNDEYDIRSQPICKKHKYEIFSSNDILLSLCQDGPIYLRSVCGKLIKKELFQDIRFPKGKLYEDMFVNYLLYNKADKIIFFQACLYYYRKRSGSIMNTTANSTFALEAEEKRYEFLKMHGKISIAKYSLPSLCWDYLLLYSNNVPNAKNKFLHYSKEYFQNSPKKNAHYLYLKLFSICPFIYYLLRKISPWHIRNN